MLTVVPHYFSFKVVLHTFIDCEVLKGLLK